MSSPLRSHSAVLGLWLLGASISLTYGAEGITPNVLFVAIDDLRTALGCYGDPLAKTPNLDRLARSARLFQHAYCHQAVCGPSRASLLTGRLPDNIQVWHNRHHFRRVHPELVTLPQLFKNQGYDTRCMGKIFSGDEREEDPPSWSVPAILRAEGWRNYAIPSAAKGKGVAYEAVDGPDRTYPDGQLADLAVSTLAELKTRGKPFFLAVGFFKPHLPFNAPKKYWDLYDAAAFSLEGEPQGVSAAPPEAFHSHRELGGYEGIPEDERVSPETARHLRHAYYACVSYTDAQVGKILEAVEQLGLTSNTILVLWGDHGYAIGERGRWCKGTNFEIDTRVPLMIRTPQLAQPGVASGGLVEYVDIYPTLAQLAGIEPPKDLDGRSLVPQLDDPAAPGKPMVLSQFARPFKASTPEVMGYSIRTDHHRYTRWIDWKTRRPMAEELYDYRDPESVTSRMGLLVEHANVAQKYPAVHRRLSDELDRLLAARTRDIPSLAKPADTEIPTQKKKRRQPANDTDGPNP